MKNNIKRYLRKYKMKKGAFADKAGIGRWSIIRYLKDGGADLSRKNYNRAEAYLTLNPKGPEG